MNSVKYIFRPHSKLEQCWIVNTGTYAIPCVLFTDLLKASVSFSALKSRENTFPKTGIAVKRGPGGMFLNS